MIVWIDEEGEFTPEQWRRLMNDQPIKGYRTLSADEINQINAIKGLAAEVEIAVANLKESGADPRWLAIGVTDLQKGFMALTRSIAKPTGF